MTITDEELDSRLRAVTSPTPGIDQAAASIIIREAARLAGKRKRRRNWLVPTAIITAGTLAIPTAAVAERFFAAQTRTFGGNYSEEMLGDEWITNEASDFPAYVASQAPRNLPVPESFDWDAASAEIVSRYVEPSQLQRIHIESDYERLIWIAWIAEWLDADRANDEVRRTTAFEAMLGAPAWEGFTESDGGGIRMLIWVSLLRYAQGDARERTEVIQTLWQQERGPAKIGEAPEPEFLLYWDGVDRQDLINDTLNEWEGFIEPYGVLDQESPVWEAYERELVRLEAETRAALGDAR
ncbi:hypothetical protein G7067_08175 [Leucobacter insecticola]|uniref:Uncharacterized protein n=1 Tax=Leucobacter insecticola TaxID=2714934 RepID=A0A6G8FJ71_9MICO|nr:hypothetical protein [Leucobacter insecticola]QIM16404.1 hypothetical protein G7067_08175 [Leucobacter insecticola]